MAIQFLTSEQFMKGNQYKQFIGASLMLQLPFITTLIDEQHDMPEEFDNVFRDNMWDLLA